MADFKSLLQISMMLLAFLCFPALKARAAVEESPPLDIVFSFYKKIGVAPDFEEWVKKTKDYMDASPVFKPEFLQREAGILQNAFNDFDPKEDLITVSGEADIILLYDPNRKSGYLDIKPQEKLNQDMISYQYGEDFFALIPTDLGDLLSFQIDENAHEKLKPAARTRRNLTLAVQFYIHQADGTEPLMMEEKPHWLLDARVVSISLLDRRDTLLWQYAAPWYITPTTKDLKALHQGK